MADPAPVATCPACGRNPIEDDETGWCSQCSDNHAVESYWAKDAPVIQARRDSWRSRSQSAAAQRERQRRHRLREKVQPREPARPNADPWELGAECLDHLQRVRAAIGANVGARHHLDEAQELVRQLAHGPLSKPADPVFNVTTPGGRMRRNMHLRWHVRGGRPCNCRPVPST